MVKFDHSGKNRCIEQKLHFDSWCVSEESGDKLKDGRAASAQPKIFDLSPGWFIGWAPQQNMFQDSSTSKQVGSRQ